MTFLPIVERELRVAARRRITYWVRWLAALFAVFVCYEFCMTVSSWKTTSIIGFELFSKLTVAAAIYCVVFGALATSDSFSSEKREGTLGLLFLTDLKGYDVVFGKLTASSLRVSYGLLAIFPVMAICIPLGGVTGGEFVRVTVVLLNALFFSMSTGILISVIFRRERGAVVGALLAVLTCSIVPSLAREYVYQSNYVNFLLALPDPLYAGQLAFDRFFSNSSGLFYSALATNHLLAWTFLMVASLRAPRCWQDRALTPLVERWKRRWHIWCQGDESDRRQYRINLLNIDPIMWLGSRDRLQRSYVWLVLTVVVAIWCLASRFMPYAWRDPLFAIFASLTFHTYLKLWVTSEACRRFADERAQGSFELLLSTPLSPMQIIEGHGNALRRQFLAPMIAVAVIDAILIVPPLTYFHDSADRLLFFVGMTLSTAYLFVDTYTLALVGLLEGLKTRNIRAAVIRTFLRVIGAPWFVFLALFALLGSPGVEAEVFWMTVLKLNDFRVINRTQALLSTDFRCIVSNAQREDSRLETIGSAGFKLFD